MLFTPHRNCLTLLTALALVWGSAARSTMAAPAYDFFICANVNQNYVIGSRIDTTNGLFQHNPANDTWQHFGYNDRTITALAFDPRDHDTIYTTTLNGIFVSTDGGESWKMTNSWDMTEGRDVAVDPQSPDTVYFALPDGFAVSTDRGQTWERRENGLPDRGKFTQAISPDRVIADRVLAGCEKGVYLTENAGRFWRQVLPTETTVNDLEQSPHDPDHWLAVTDSHGAWRSRDGGQTWALITYLPNDRAIYNATYDPTTPGRQAIASWAHGVWTSEDGGDSWTQRSAGLPENPKAWRVGVDPNSGRLYVSVFEDTLYYSDDFGRSWEPDALAGSSVNAFISIRRENR